MISYIHIKLFNSSKYRKKYAQTFPQRRNLDGQRHMKNVQHNHQRAANQNNRVITAHTMKVVRHHKDKK